MELVPEEEFSDFFERTQRKLLAQAYLLTGDRQDAQDLVQETYLRAWRGWGRVAGMDSPEAWLRRVLYNLAVGRWRRLAVRRSRNGSFDVPLSVPGTSIGHLDVVKVLQSLPPKQRQALVLTAFVGLSTAEAAKEMRASEGTVRVWVSRARARVAEALGLDVLSAARKGEADAG
ncbi:MAG TPA: SigE family RNA polymerase sigma factor [Acidimicrobiales bacterium]|nr:SigE family RNA polymerase sigma factor [Acidimicrobiales bacterium]